MAPATRRGISRGTWIELGLALALAAWTVSMAYRWGHMEARVEALERWRDRQEGRTP